VAKVERRRAGGKVANGTLAIDADDFDLRSGADYRTGELYPKFAAQGRELRHCTGFRASRQALSAELRSNNGYSYVTGFGHGESHRFTNLGQTILGSHAPYAADLLLYKSKVVHLLSCDTASELGPALIQAGCRAFIGYRGEFLFPASAEEDGEPLSLEEIQALFWECASEVDAALADGESVKVAHERASAAFTKLLEEFEQYELSVAYVIRIQTNLARLSSPLNDATLGDATATI
jgi:hypothetical protein